MGERIEFPKPGEGPEVPTRETKLTDELALSLLNAKTEDGSGVNIQTTPGQNAFVEMLAKQMTDQAPRTEADIAARALAQLALQTWRGAYVVANEARGPKASGAKAYLRATCEDIYRNYIIATGLRLVDERTEKERKTWVGRKLELVRLWWASL